MFGTIRQMIVDVGHRHPARMVGADNDAEYGNLLGDVPTGCRTPGSRGDLTASRRFDSEPNRPIGDNVVVNPRTNTELVAAVNDVLLTTLSVARDLTEDDADLPTDCPGWTVRDQLAHMVGLEQVLQGAPQPDIELPPLDHVKNDFAVMMEQQVQIRRQLPLVAICDELDGLRRRRADTLGNLVKQGDPEVDGPFGRRPLSQSLPIRVFDLWAHEQDIRRAVGLPVRDDCDAAEIGLERSLLGWSSGLAKQLEGVDATVVVEVTEPATRTERFDLGDGGETVTISGSLGEITRAFCGRSGVSIGLDGPADLLAVIQPALGMTP